MGLIFLSAPKQRGKAAEEAVEFRLQRQQLLLVHKWSPDRRSVGEADSSCSKFDDAVEDHLALRCSTKEVHTQPQVVPLSGQRGEAGVRSDQRGIKEVDDADRGLEASVEPLCHPIRGSIALESEQVIWRTSLTQDFGQARRQGRAWFGTRRPLFDRLIHPLVRTTVANSHWRRTYETII
jgi:hypothetical protein